jgi:hypothetical protein
MKKKEKVMKQKKFKVRGTTLFVYKTQKNPFSDTTPTITATTMACAVI